MRGRVLSRTEAQDHDKHVTSPRPPSRQETVKKQEGDISLKVTILHSCCLTAVQKGDLGQVVPTSGQS